MRNCTNSRPIAIEHSSAPFFQCTAFRALSIVVSVLAACVAMPAIGDAGHNHGSVSNNGRFTPNSQGAPFPPQPRNATGMRNFSPNNNPAAGRVGVQSATADAVSRRSIATSAVKNDSAVQNALGARYAHISTALVRNKWGSDKTSYRVTFFSHSNNQTVSAKHGDGEVSDLKVTPAAQLQPPLAKSEMDEAISIARAHWVAQSNSRIGSLTGYAIQTYRDDGSPHLTRIAYVSFHVDSPEAPELLTWVDLNSQRVVRAQENR